METRRHTRKKNKKNNYPIGLKYLVLVILFFGVILWGTRSYIHGVVNQETFYEGVSIEGVELGGKTTAQAEAELVEKFQEKINNLRIHLAYQGETWNIKARDIGAALDVQQKVASAYGVARNGNTLKRFIELRRIRKDGYNEELNITYDPELMKKKLMEIAKKTDVNPQDAKLKFQSSKKNKVVVEQEKEGRSLNIEKTMFKISEALKSSSVCSVELEMEIVKPQVFAQDLEKLTYKIASFSTSLGSSDADRKHNVFFAAKSFNERMISPGDIFSFNESTGERTLEKGYRNAPVITQNKSLEDGPGGGVCQASTTLYNTVLLAGLEITSRAHHSFPSSYVKPGFDATVNYPSTDFKFRNNRSSPIFLISYPSGNNLVVELYGERLEDGMSYKLINEVYETIPAPEPEIRQDTKKEHVTYTDEQYVWVESRKGIKVRTYRISLKDGKQIKKDLIVDDYYKPIKGIIYVGVEERPQEPEQTPSSEQTEP